MIGNIGRNTEKQNIKEIGTAKKEKRKKIEIGGLGFFIWDFPVFGIQEENQKKNKIDSGLD